MGEIKGLEAEQENETRIFCIFYNNSTGKYRVTGSDLVIVDNIKTNCNFTEVINSIIEYARGVGEKILKKDIKAS